jgi:uncharacterized protein (UPF0276 family)
LNEAPAVSWFEAISENFIGIRSGNGGRPIRILEKVRANYPVALHGVSLSIGSSDPLDGDYLKKLKALYARIEPSIVSDHLCWTGVDGENLHDLLPLPYTREVAEYVAGKILRVQEFLGRRMLFENVSSYLTFADSEMTEWEFISEIASRSGCGVLLDVNNVHVSAVNHGFDAMDFIRGIPPEAVGQFHLAGYSDMGTHLIDTHDHPVSDPVWRLYAEAVARFGDVPTLIEWDDKIPAFDVLAAEAAHATRVKDEILRGRGRAKTA